MKNPLTKIVIDRYREALLLMNKMDANDELYLAVQGMLENYLELKRLSLISARSENPNWGKEITAEGDIHVVRVRKALKRFMEERGIKGLNAIRIEGMNG